jgi:predicted transcriptional regulator
MHPTVKLDVIEMIERLPDDASVEDIMAELCSCQEVDEGLRQLDRGDTVEHEEAKRKLGKWLS